MVTRRVARCDRGALVRNSHSAAGREHEVAGGSKLLLHYFNSVCVGRVRGMREMRGTRAAWCARGGRAAAAVQRRSGAGERRWRGAARRGAGGGVARGTSGAARTKGLLAKGFLRMRKSTHPSTLVIAAQRPASSFRGRIVLQLPRSLLLLARLQTVLPRRWTCCAAPRRWTRRGRSHRWRFHQDNALPTQRQTRLCSRHSCGWRARTPAACRLP